MNPYLKLETRTETLQVRIEPSIKLQLQVLAEKSGLSQSEYIRQLVKVQFSSQNQEVPADEH